jgi:hypothetical protein
MKYLLLAYHTEEKTASLSKQQMDAMSAACRQYDDALRESGHVISMGGLGWTRDAMTVRSRGGKTAVTDGPFVESKEKIGGYFLIEAKDLNEAVRVASSTAPARLGEELGWGIEVRSLEEFFEV